jgi:chemotaxis protein CheY-P-specific phosphatase CheC
MLEMQNQVVLESLADSFETMAFVFFEPVELPVEPPADAVRVSIPFKSGGSGVVEMVASRNLGRILTANMLGTEPDEAETDQHVDATLREMMNVFGGLMVRRNASQTGKNGELGLPQIEPFDVAQWDEFTKSAGLVLLAEGSPIAIRIRESDSPWRSN